MAAIGASDTGQALLEFVAISIEGINWWALISKKLVSFEKVIMSGCWLSINTKVLHIVVTSAAIVFQTIGLIESTNKII